MKKMLAAAAVLALLSACAPQSSTASPAATAAPDAGGQAAQAAVQTASETPTRTVQAEITPPEGWEAVAGSVLPVHYMKETASFMVKEEALQSDTPDGLIAEAKDIFESAFDKVSYVGDTEALTVDGYDARKFVFTCEISGLPMKYEYVYLLAGGTVWAVTFGDTTESFDTHAADYEQILSELRFRS